MEAPIKLRVSKLDKRHTGNHWYSHRVTFEGGGYWNKTNAFCAARDWLQDTYGKSREVGFIGHLRDQPKPVWSWETNYNYFRLYLTKESATAFGLVMDRFKEIE